MSTYDKDFEKEFPLEIASKIVLMLNNVTGENVNFMSAGGVIIATMQPNRLGTIHEGAKKIMAGEVNELAITSEDAQKLKGVLPGYNGVVMYNEKRLGCIGLSGDPYSMKPLQKLAEIITREEYLKYLNSITKEKTIIKITEEIAQMTATIEEISLSGIESLNHSKTIENMANDSEKYLEDINNVLKTINDITKQVKLLGLNASIESARVGEAGRGFGVVAKEMGKLSVNSSNSLKDMNTILNDVKSSIINIAEGIRNNTKIINEQSTALQHITSGILGIQKEMERLS